MYQFIKGFSLAIALMMSGSSVAQTTGANDFLSRASSSSDSFNCFFVAQSAFPTTLVGDDFKVQPFIQPLNIFTITGLGLINNTEADNIIDDDNELVNIDNGANDIGCRVQLRREGNVSSLTPPNTVVGGVITTSADLDTMRNATGNSRGDVLVVAGLTFCGGAGSFNGCASAGRSMVVTDSAPSGVWFHEYGHVQGLGHRPDTANNCSDPGNENIMFPIGCSNLERVDTDECSALFVGAGC